MLTIVSLALKYIFPLDWKQHVGKYHIDCVHLCVFHTKYVPST